MRQNLKLSGFFFVLSKMPESRTTTGFRGCLDPQSYPLSINTRQEDHVSEPEKGHFGRGRKGINAIPRAALKLRLNTAQGKAKMLCTPASWQLMRLAKNGLATGASQLRGYTYKLCAPVAGIEPRWSIILLFVIVWIS